MKLNSLNIIKLAVASAATAISLSANAVIISGAQTTGEGKVVNLQGLDWMSFDHMEGGTDYTSLGAKVRLFSDSDSIWSDAGWELASYEQVSLLHESLGFTLDSSTSNADGNDFMFDNWGHDTSPLLQRTYTQYQGITSAYKLAYGVFKSNQDNRIGIASFQDESTYERVDLVPGGVDYTDSVYNADYSNLVVDWASDDTDGSISMLGAFFIRTSVDAEVPEPTILGLMGLGIFGLGLSRRKMKKQHQRGQVL